MTGAGPSPAQVADAMLWEVVYTAHLTHTSVADLLAMDLPTLQALRAPVQRLAKALNPKER